MANYGITQNLTKLTKSNMRLTLQAANHYELPANSSNITITNGTIVSYNKSTGDLVVNGDDTTVISLTCSAEQQTITGSVSHGGFSAQFPTIYYGGTYDVYIYASSDYTLPETLTSITGVSSFTYDAVTGKITFTVSGDVNIQADCVYVGPSYFNLNLNANGGSFVIGGTPTSAISVQTYYGHAATDIAGSQYTPPTRNGYRFLGWNWNSSDTTVLTDAELNQINTGTNPLYAIWEQTYTVNFSTAYGTWKDSNNNTVTYASGVWKNATITTSNNTLTISNKGTYSFTPSTGRTFSSFSYTSPVVTDQTITVNAPLNKYTISLDNSYGNWYASGDFIHAVTSITNVPYGSTLSVSQENTSIIIYHNAETEADISYSYQASSGWGLSSFTFSSPVYANGTITANVAPVQQFYSITTSASSGSGSFSGDNQIEQKASATATIYLTASSGYKVPTSSNYSTKISVANATIQSYTQNTLTTGTLVITNPTANVIVSVAFDSTITYQTLIAKQKLGTNSATTLNAWSVAQGSTVTISHNTVTANGNTEASTGATGYSFRYWYNQDVGDTGSGISSFTMPSKTVSVIAKWTPTEYTANVSITTSNSGTVGSINASISSSSIPSGYTLSFSSSNANYTSISDYVNLTDPSGGSYSIRMYLWKNGTNYGSSDNPYTINFTWGDVYSTKTQSKTFHFTIV